MTTKAEAEAIGCRFRHDLRQIRILEMALWFGREQRRALARWKYHQEILETFIIRKYLEFYEHTCFKPLAWKVRWPHL